MAVFFQPSMVFFRTYCSRRRGVFLRCRFARTPDSLLPGESGAYKPPRSGGIPWWRRSSGYAGALVAVLSLARNRYLHVVYREVSREEGFVITGFVSRKINRSLILWPERR